MTSSQVQVIKASADQLYFYVYDALYNPQTGVDTETPIDLSSVSQIKMEWSLEGKAQADLDVTAQADQVASPGECWAQLESGTIPGAGEIDARLKWVDGNARPQKSDKFRLKVEE